MLALSVYSDKTMTRTLGQRTYYPMVITITNMPPELTGKVDNKIIIGYIPEVKQPSGYSNRLFKNGKRALFGACWQQILHDIQSIEHDHTHPIEVKLLDSKQLLAVPVVIAAFGDYPEQQDVCGVSSGAKASTPCRVCLVKQSQLHKFYRESEQCNDLCQHREISGVLEQLHRINSRTRTQQQRTQLLREAGSLTGHVPPLMLYTGFNTCAGVFAATPADKLHHVKGGISKTLLTHILQALKGITGNSYNAALRLWTERLQALPVFDDPVTEKRFRKFSGDILTAKGLTSDTQLALIFSMKWGIGEVPDVFDAALHKEILLLLLKFERFYIFMSEKQSFTVADLDELEALLSSFVRQWTHTLGAKSRFKYNMQAPKVHAVSHLRMWIQRYGAWLNWCTGKMNFE